MQWVAPWFLISTICSLESTQSMVLSWKWGVSKNINLLLCGCLGRDPLKGASFLGVREASDLSVALDVSLWRPSASGSELQSNPTPSSSSIHPSLACYSCTSLSRDEISDQAPWRLLCRKAFHGRDLKFSSTSSLGDVVWWFSRAFITI